MNILKKSFILIVLCILCTACGSNNDTKSDNAQNVDRAKLQPVAIIENYEELSDSISIQRANGTPTGADALLYQDDKITGKVGDLQIKCAPYAGFKITNDECVISYEPPSQIGEIAYNVAEYAGSFWTNVESVNTGASRGTDDDLNLNPKPGFDVTLMQNQSVTFSWDGSAKKFYIKDDKGKNIFDVSVAGKNSVEIIPNKINLNAEQKYSWSLDDNSQSYQFTILDAQTEKEISDKLAEIDAENISNDERILKKSAYVQLISDIYSNKIDLYWLSAQWLSEMSSADENLKNTKNVLMRKCAHHLDEEM